MLRNTLFCGSELEESLELGKRSRIDGAALKRGQHGKALTRKS